MDLRAEASSLAALFQGGAITEENRRRFIDFRTELFRRGVYDPVLARFDSYTVGQITPAEAAAQLQVLSGTL